MIRFSKKNPDIYISLSLAIRAKILSLLIYFVLALVIIVLLAIEFSARQLATTALDVGLSIIRIGLPLLIILLAQELFSREFERKSYLSTFTYPRSRFSWLIARVATIVLIALSALVLMGIVLAALTTFAAADYQQATPVSLGVPYVTTLSFIAIDLLVVTAIATLLAVSAKTPSFVLLGTIGFIMIARSYTPIIELLKNNPYTVSEVVDPQLYQDSLGLIAFLLPDLGRLDVRMIALYDKMMFLPADWPWLVLATLAYVVTILGIAAWVLNKREFN